MATTRRDRYGEHRTAFEKNKKIIIASGDTCAICGGPVDKTLKHPHPMSPSVDHIIPLARGGHPSDIANLQLTHLWCNKWKSDRLESVTIELKAEESIISNRDLPQHYDWSSYVA